MFDEIKNLVKNAGLLNEDTHMTESLADIIDPHDDLYYHDDTTTTHEISTKDELLSKMKNINDNILKNENYRPNHIEIHKLLDAAIKFIENK